MRILSCTLLLAIATTAHAQSAIQLEPLPGATAPDVVATSNYTGRCDGSIVRVMGVTSTLGKTFSGELDAAKIIVRDGPRHEIEIATNDFTGLACVDSFKGKRLVVWSQCGGSACGDDLSFEIYDPKSLARLTPDPMKVECGAACAAKVLGSDLPFTINKR